MTAQQRTRVYYLILSVILRLPKVVFSSTSQNVLFWKSPLQNHLHASNSCSILFDYLVTGKEQRPNPYYFWVFCRDENEVLWKEREWFWVQNAEYHLKQDLVKVTDKEFASPSGNPRDYVSHSTYYWPDPTKPDGLPYILIDGKINLRAVQGGDLTRLAQLRRRTFDLGFAWNRTGDSRFAERAVEQLQVWFLDPNCSMTPHLLYTMGVPGRYNGSPHGLIETLYFLELIDGVNMLSGYEGWTDGDKLGLQLWFQQYLDWFLTSSHGKREAETNNNHGSWYTAQAVKFALFVGRTDVAHHVLEHAIAKRFPEQFVEDCTQPQELARSNAFLYEQYNLLAWFNIAEIALDIGKDFYALSDKGRSLKCALDWIVPFANGQKEWKMPRLGSRGTMNLVSMLCRASQLWGDTVYEETLSNLVKLNLQADVVHDSSISSYLSGGVVP